MAAIKTNFGQGGVGLQPQHGLPNLATALRDVADDLTALNSDIGVIASADAIDLPTAITLVNEIKAAINAAPAVLLTTKA